MPPGSDATTGAGKEAGTRPSPSPAAGACSNVAPTELSALITTGQPCVPEHGPLQPEKLQPVSGCTPSVTEVFSANCALQLGRQSIPEGVDTIRPDPCTVTFNVCTRVSGGGVVWKVAFAVASALIGKVQAPVPEQAPSHPEKVALASGVAVRVTACEKVPTQAEPHSIPDGKEVTLPFPETCTVRVWDCGPVELPWPHATSATARVQAGSRMRPSSTRSRINL